MNIDNKTKINIFLEFFNSTGSDLCVMDKDLTIIGISSGYAIRHGLANIDFVGLTASEIEEQRLFFPSVGAICARTRKKATIMQANHLGEHVLSTASPIFNEKGELEYILCYNAIDIADCTPPEKFEQAKNIVKKYYENLSHDIIQQLAINELNSTSVRMENILK